MNTWKSINTASFADAEMYLIKSNKITPTTTYQHCFSKYANELCRLSTTAAHFN